MSGTTNVQRLYGSVVGDVINNVREAFLDEGVDEQVLLELKQLWESKLAQSKAVESGPSANEKLMQTYAQAQKGPINVQPTKKYVPPPTILTQLGVGGRIEMSRRYQNSYNVQHHQNMSIREHPNQRRFPFDGFASCRTPYQSRPIQPRYHHPPPPHTTQPGACSYDSAPAPYNNNNHSYNRAPCAYSTPSSMSMGASQAAATATVALPQMYQHQLGAGSFTLQGSTDQPTFIIQPSGQVLTTSTGMSQLPIQAAIQTGQSATQGGRVVYTLPIQTTTAAQQAQVQPGVQVAGTTGILQLDGAHDSSSDDDDDFDDDDKDDDNDDEQNEEDNEYQGEEEEPLNSGDDVSDVDPSELFDADNVVVCQYDKINRCKAKWKFHLKDGIMNLNGKDYVFQKATGDADW
ncbi:transcription initiation factor IIA subunit 1-like isoform X2 [Tubulanus polymorphus]|uniref:transcription initiation factor IIA subunit 1-like isoform X2 n=1 Tax=Tubulanus polymorphus TaxID=672921 RepID=UPI003DA4B89A